MKAEVITIGVEILRGEIVDSNKALIAERVLGLDIECHYQSSVRDDRADMRFAFEHPPLPRLSGFRPGVSTCAGAGSCKLRHTIPPTQRLPAGNANRCGHCQPWPTSECSQPESSIGGYVE